MGLRFILRGTSLDAHFSYAGKTAAPFGNIVDDPALVVNTSSGVFGTSVINMNPASVTKGLIFPGYTNVCAASNNGTFSVLCRIVPTTTASPFLGYGVIEVGCSRNPYGFAYRCGINSAGKCYVQLADQAGNLTTYTGTTVINSTTNVPFEVMFTWNGTAAANAIKISKDGVEIESITSTNTCSSRTMLAMSNLITGSISAGPTTTKAHLNELIVWDSVESHTYTARTDFWSQSAFDGASYTDPGVATVLTGQTYTYAGQSQTGTLDTATSVWNAATASYGTTGSYGKLLEDYLDAAVSSRLASASYSAPPSAATVASTVWGEATSGYTTSGTFGYLMQRLLTVAKFLGLKD